MICLIRCHLQSVSSLHTKHREAKLEQQTAGSPVEQQIKLAGVGSSDRAAAVKKTRPQ